MPVEFIDIDFGKPEHAPECSRFQLIVQGNDRTGFTFRSHL